MNSFLIGIIIVLTAHVIVDGISLLIGRVGIAHA